MSWGFERGAVLRALEAAGGNKELAANMLLDQQPRAALPPAEASSQRFPPQSAVTIHGLKGAPQHNGKRGVTIGEFDAGLGRYVVKMEDGTRARIKPTNLSIAEGLDGGVDGGQSAWLDGRIP